MTDKHFHSGKPRPSSMNSTHPPPTELHGNTRAQTRELPKAALEHPRSRGSTYHRTPYPNTNAGTGSYPASSRDQTPFESTKGMKKVGRHSGYSPAGSWGANELGFNPLHTCETTHPVQPSVREFLTGSRDCGSASGGQIVSGAQYPITRPSPEGCKPLGPTARGSENARLYGTSGFFTNYGKHPPFEDSRSSVHLEEQNHGLREQISNLEKKLSAQKAYSAQLAHRLGEWQSAYDRAPDHFRFSEASPVRGGDVEEAGGGTATDLVGYYRDELEQTTIYADTLKGEIAGLEGYIEAMERLLEQYVKDDVSRTMRRHDRSRGK